MNTPIQDYHSAVAAIRPEITNTVASIAAVERVDANAAEARANAAAYVARSVASGQELTRTASRLAAKGDIAEAFRLPTRFDRVDLGPILALALGQKAFEKIISASIEEFAPDGPDAAARAAKIAELKQQLHALEVEEENLVTASESTRYPVLRRPDADPAVVLKA